jgi:perosamine synthetase
LDWARHVWWLFTVILDEEIGLDRFEAIAGLLDRGVEARQIVYPITQLPPYFDAARKDDFPVADRVVDRGIQLPTWCGLTRDDVHHICQSLKELATVPSARPVA